MISKNALSDWRVGIAGLLVVCLSILLAPSLFGQSSATGALTGTIKDPSGAVIPNATVTLTSVNTGAVRTATTGADGVYRFTLLSPGTYRVRLEAGGFKPVEIPSVTVNVTETAVLDRSLEVGGQTQTVTVEGEVVAIQTTSSTLGTVANARTMVDLPLNTRNYTNLLAMSGGVSADVENASLLGKGATRMAVNGGATGQNTYLEDGIVTNSWSGFNSVSEGVTIGSFAMPNPDAIAEFKIQTSTYDAGYGRNPGANVNVVTKSGTNSFHGSAFEFFRNSALNANDWFLNRSGTPKPVLNSNQYGGAVGGPIKKDKLFFFASYQETDQKSGLSAFSQSSVVLPPIPAGDRGTCNGGNPGWYNISACDTAGQAFIQNLAALASSSKPKQGSVRIQNPSACPVGGCDAAGLFNMNPIAISILQAKIPGYGYAIPGSGTSGYLSTNLVSPAFYKDHQGIGNLDYQVNSKNTVSTRYIFETDPINAPFGVPNAQEPGSALLGWPITARHTDQTAIVRLTTIMSSNIVNDLHGAYQRDVSRSSRPSPLTNSQFGIADFFSPFAPLGKTDTLSEISLNGGPKTGLFTMGPFSAFGGLIINNQFAIGDQVSWTHGKHTVRTGIDFQRFQRASQAPFSSAGAPTFQTFADLLIGRAGCGLDTSGNPIISSPSVANPGGCNGAGIVNGATAITSNIIFQSAAGKSASANGGVQTNIRVYDVSAFVQDDIKVTQRLTLNAGLRWEFDQYPTETAGNMGGFLPSLASTGPAPFVTVPGGPGESLAGYIMPNNYRGVIPTGVYQSPVPYFQGKRAPMDDFAPRLGFAWQPLSTSKLVLRGGVGIFYDLLASGDESIGSTPLTGGVTNGVSVASLANPWAIAPGVVSAGPGYFGFLPRWVDLSTVSNNPLAACAAPPCSSNTTPQAWTEAWTVPTTYEWNLNAQYEFAPSWVMEIGYVGSHGINQVTPGAVSGNTADGTPIANPYNVAQLVGVGAPCVSCAVTGVNSNSNGNAILRVPILGVAATATTDQTNSAYKYNALQATVRKQFSHGLQLQGAYTWARALEQAPQGTNVYPYVVQTYSPEYLVRPHRFVINYVWELPLGHQQGWLGKVREGWSWSGVTTVQDGAPQDIVDSRGGRVFGVSAGLGGTIGHAQLCPGMTAANIATSGTDEERVTSGIEGGNGWINSAAFCAPPTGIGAINGAGGGTGFGNMGAGNVLGPGQFNFDMSLAKVTKIRESESLEFRAEFYNIFNHPQFASINDTDAADQLVPGDPTTGGLGSIIATSVAPRIIQFGLKFLF